MRRGIQVMRTIRGSHRHGSRLRASRVGVLVVALAVWGACSGDDDSDDAGTATATTDTASTGSDSGATNSVDPTASTATVDSMAPASNATVADCADDVELLDADEELVAVEPEATFERRWEIENIGDCTWSSDYAWTFTGGDALTIESVTPVAEVAPGESIEITVALRAPAEPGRYAGQFQLVAPGTMEPLGEAAPYTVEVTR